MKKIELLTNMIDEYTGKNTEIKEDMTVIKHVIYSDLLIRAENITGIDSSIINKVIDELAITCEYIGLDIKLTFTDTKMTKDYKEINYIIKGIYQEGYKYINISEILVNKSLNSDDADEIIIALQSLKLSYKNTPGFKGVDLSNEEQLLSRSAFILVNKYEMFEECYNRLRNSIRPYEIAETDSYFINVNIFYTYVKQGLNVGKIIVENKMYKPLVKVEEYDGLFASMEESMQKLFEYNDDFQNYLTATIAEASKQI